MSARKKSSRRWPAHFLARIGEVRRRMGEKKLDALLVNYPHDIRYLTGFSGEDSWALVTRSGVVIFSDRRFEEELTVHCAYARRVMRKKSLSEELEKVAKRQRLRRVGFQAEHMTVAGRRNLANH